MTSDSSLYHAFDLDALRLLPAGWVAQVMAVADQFAAFVHLEGDSPTSREPAGTAGSDYYVVTGDIIQAELPWLHHLYTTELAALASRAAHKAVQPSTQLKSGININVVRGVGARYEWHVDSNPLTGMLYVTTHTADDGGELVFRPAERDTIVHPRSGLFIVFDARAIPHAVLPLKRDQVRLSIPMNYYDVGQAETRPPELDAYIYKAGEAGR